MRWLSPVSADALRTTNHESHVAYEGSAHSCAAAIEYRDVYPQRDVD
jgi:hypothetical protein